MLFARAASFEAALDAEKARSAGLEKRIAGSEETAAALKGSVESLRLVVNENKATLDSVAGAVERNQALVQDNILSLTKLSEENRERGAENQESMVSLQQELSKLKFSSEVTNPQVMHDDKVVAASDSTTPMQSAIKTPEQLQTIVALLKEQLPSALAVQPDDQQSSLSHQSINPDEYVKSVAADSSLFNMQVKYPHGDLPSLGTTQEANEHGQLSCVGEDCQKDPLSLE